IVHSQLQHPNIIPFLGVYPEQTEAPPLIIMPYMESGSLMSWIAERRIGLRELKAIAFGIGRGVAYLHSREPQLIHWNLHPANVLLDNSGNPLLCDFGFTPLRREVSQIRMIGQESGKIRFLAPELSSSVQNRFRRSPESDIFSFAMILFSMWSGEKPFAMIHREWEVAASLAKGRRPNRPVASVLPPKISRALWKLLLSMWAQDPNERPSISDVLSSLEHTFQ
ncbi:kinase-like protein, partial [Clavulina sp. PMI_390]